MDKTVKNILIGVAGVIGLWVVFCTINNANHPTHTTDELYAGHVAGELFKDNLRKAFDK
jgi:hypothetical protein